MKTVLIVVACVVAVVAVVVLGVGWWGSQQKIDVGDPNVAEHFKSSFVKSCVQGIDTRLSSSGQTATADQDAKFTQLCGCMADKTMAKMQQNGGVKVADIALHPEQFAQQMQESSKVCADRLGLQGN